MRLFHFFALVVLLALPAPQAAFAVLPDEVLADPVLEARARDLSKGLRCLVCRNQSIDDSNADLARDLRLLLRERLVAGDDDAQVLQYLVDRYGIYILLKPPFKTSTALLWLGPALLFMIALLGFSALWWRRPDKPSDPYEMSEDDRAVLAAVLQNKEIK